MLTSSGRQFNTDGARPILRKPSFNKCFLRETGARRNDVIDIFMDELEKNDGKVFSQQELELGFVSTSLLFFFAGIAQLSSDVTYYSLF